jgi:hypothetical protein
METLVVAALLGLIPAAIAQPKGRSFGLWWLYGFLLFIVALIHSLMLDEAKPCPQCAEIIKHKAKVCRFCGSPVETDEAKRRTSPLALVVLILMVIVGGLALVSGLNTQVDTIFTNVDASLPTGY